MKPDAISVVRKQLLALGYYPLPNNCKIPAVKGWNSPDFIAREMKGERIEQWPERFEAPTIGVLITGGLCVIDIDVNHPLSGELFAAALAIAPQLDQAPVRFGASEHKMALFCRTEDVFVRKASKKYDGHLVEIFGGAPLRNGHVSRQFGIYGKYDDTADYSWAIDVPELAAVALADLPALTLAEAVAICGAFESLADKAGWVAEVQPTTDRASVVYDIDDTTRFDTNRAGRGLSYAELSEAQEALGNLRCSSSFMKGRDGNDPERCWVYYSKRHDCTAVHVYGDEAAHFHKKFAPIADPIGEKIKFMQSTPQSAGSKPDDDAELEVKALWLLDNYGYCALSDTVVELTKPRFECQIKPLAFARLYRAWREEFEGPKGGKRFNYATGYWEVNPKRVDIEGIRMRPDMPFPTYQENGQTWKNTYLRPRHEIVGDLAPFMAFMERFLPDRTEREWLFDWMAHKMRRPDIPGTAIVFVADDEDSVQEGEYGTGRGLFFRFVHRLYGEQYARAQTFSVMDGSSGQSQFTAWMHGSILVTVDESRTSATAYRRGERSATYNILKDIVDPAPKRHEFKVKGGQAIDGISYCSYMVATNHGDAVAIPEGDRRFTILSNGRTMNPVERSHMVAWLDSEGSAGAVSQFLMQRNIDGFDMFWPLVTGGKTRMIDKARTDVENIMRGFMNDEAFPLAFTKRYMAAMVEHNLEVKGSFWQGEFTKAWSSYCSKILTAIGGPKRLLVDGRQQEVFCYRGRRHKLEQMPNSLLSVNINRNPRIAENQQLSNVTPLFTKI